MTPLQRLIEFLEYKTTAYSGRFMYGEECLGVKNIKEPQDFLKELLFEIDLWNERCLPEFTINLDTKDYRVDTLGKHYIVYFPYIEYVDSGEDED
jgi:hypothetical protein